MGFQESILSNVVKFTKNPIKPFLVKSNLSYNKFIDFLTPLLEVKLPYEPVCQSVGWSICHNCKFHFPCSYRSTCLFVLTLFSVQKVTTKLSSAILFLIIS